MAHFDLVVVGAGIVGLAHALAARERGLRVAVVEREARACDASVRNFGFVTVSGQGDGDTRRRALRSRDTWERVARDAGIPVVQRGALVVARRAEALQVLESFAATAMGAGCERWDRARLRRDAAMVADGAAGALWSPHELRIEAREALPRLASWLAERGVAFSWRTTAIRHEGARLHCAAGDIDADAAIFAPGHGWMTSFPEVAREEEARVCRLQMMRLAPPAFTLPWVLMTDASLVRYEGFAAQPAAEALRERLVREMPAAIDRGVHLIVAQSADGSLVVGDSHAYGETSDPFASDETDALILREFETLLGAPPRVIERWNGYYAVAKTRPLVRRALGERSRLVVVTSGTGMSTAFAIAEETLAELFP